MELGLCQKQCRLLRAIHLHMYTVTTVFVCVVLPVVQLSFMLYTLLLFLVNVVLFFFLIMSFLKQSDTFVFMLYCINTNIVLRCHLRALIFRVLE